MASPRLMIVITGATALAVGAIIALALGTWWVLILALAVHAVATVAVVGYAWQRASQTHDKPDPVTEARVEEERGGRPERRRRRPRDREVFD